MFAFRRIFDSFFGTNRPIDESNRVRKLRQLSENEPDLAGILDPIIELVWINDNASPEIEKKLKINNRSIKDLEHNLSTQSDRNHSLESKNRNLEFEIKSLKDEREILDEIVMDLEFYPEGSLKHSLAIEKFIEKEPELAKLINKPEEENHKIRPTLFSTNKVEKARFPLYKEGKKDTFQGIIGDLEVITFTAAKSENNQARLSEDRIGFSIDESKCRLVAVDGVASSTHSRHLANKICKETLMEKRKLNAVLRDFQAELQDISHERSNDEKARQLEVFNKEQRSRGSACVICIADFDFSSRTVTIAHVGDSVCFVEVENQDYSRASTRWEVFPKMTREDFDRTPSQLNSAFPDRHTSPEKLQVRNATGRIIVCTDGMAEYIIRNDPDSVIGSIIDDDPKTCLDKMRKGKIEDDDLSFIALHSNKLLSNIRKKHKNGGFTRRSRVNNHSK